MDNGNILEVEGLSVEFDGRRVVDDVSYSLPRGLTLGIVGESGSGKSVSTLALVGLLPKNARIASGRALLGGDDLLGMDDEALRLVRGRRIGMIFQEPMTSLNPVHRCGDQVVEAMMQAGLHHGRRAACKERAIELFGEVLLPRPEKIFNSYPHELSGGQKQRVMIAMALACEPDVVVADEPTTALDVTVQKTILTLLRRLQQRHGTSIIFISHDLGVVAEVADEVAVMYHGRIVERGPASQVLHHPTHPYTQGLLACRPPLDSHPRRLPTVDDYMAGRPDGTGPSGQSPLATDETPSPKPLIAVRDLHVTYTLQKDLLGRPLQTLNAVDGVSFDILEGETLGLVGESGCGKSTLGRALLGLQPRTAGSVTYRNRDLASLSASQMRALRPRLQIIFQDPYSSLNPRLTIGQAIEEPLVATPRALSHTPAPLHDRQARARVVADLMEQVGLASAWRNRYPHELSGGQRQRVCIARALILQPELVVCDESVSALDVSVQAQVLNLLNDLKELHHYTYLFITHDLSVVHYMADRIMVMRKGKIVEQGTPDDLFHHPQTDYTRNLIEAIPRV